MKENKRLFIEWVESMWVALNSMSCDPSEFIGMGYEEIEKAKAYLEMLQNNSSENFTEYSTKELYEELLKREGIREIEVGMGETVEILDFYKRGSIDSVSGPARLVINID
jgi:hypothetical protein